MKIVDDTKMHIAIFRDIPIAISSHKGVLKNYMKNIRGLRKDEYELSEIIITEDNYYECQYEDLMLVKFYGIYIPSIDIKIIDIEYRDLSQDIENFIDKTKYFAFLFNQSGDSAVVDTTIKLMKELLPYKDGKKYDKLNRVHMLGHPIMSCDMREYFTFLKNYKESREMIKRYRQLSE